MKDCVIFDKQKFLSPGPIIMGATVGMPTGPLVIDYLDPKTYNSPMGSRLGGMSGKSLLFENPILNLVDILAAEIREPLYTIFISDLLEETVKIKAKTGPLSNSKGCLPDEYLTRYPVEPIPVDKNLVLVYEPFFGACSLFPHSNCFNKFKVYKRFNGTYLEYLITSEVPDSAEALLQELKGIRNKNQSYISWVHGVSGLLVRDFRRRSGQTIIQRIVINIETEKVVHSSSVSGLSIFELLLGSLNLGLLHLDFGTDGMDALRSCKSKYFNS